MASRKSTKKSKGNGRGGRRPGAGRPPERPGPRGIRWTKVRAYARLGGDRDDIVTALGLTSAQLSRPEVVARFQEELDRGAALHRLDLLGDIKRIRMGGNGSVNATVASLREKLGWDRPDSARKREQNRPDADAAVAELERILRRARAPR